VNSSEGNMQGSAVAFATLHLPYLNEYILTLIKCLFEVNFGFPLGLGFSTYRQILTSYFHRFCNNLTVPSLTCICCRQYVVCFHNSVTYPNPTVSHIFCSNHPTLTLSANICSDLDH